MTATVALRDTKTVMVIIREVMIQILLAQWNNPLSAYREYSRFYSLLLPIKLVIRKEMWA